MLRRRNPGVVCRAENLSGLLQGVFNFASREECCCSGVRILILTVLVNEPKFVVIYCGSVESSYWANYD